ncbi:unnamed protein product (macronuclear) [Paramecium tetraurelia]|uniref:Kelch motif family protein n=1 Tax=Paramecium tetraurelia TaxID=5888 RepID=A0C8G0_PARTE|nr:uncharacterized protein GSPATT00036210001 [Paramecium tetraurelia]CAK67077.1 unnamed protein product [Paramecium tetraurelia]|eukprot:XP_001434474.1 hypothetical protein (macronuclear) [Paramecium tetraurelia strain d4-2]
MHQRERRRIYSLQNREPINLPKYHIDVSMDNLQKRKISTNELPQLIQNKMQMINYTNSMQLQLKTKYEQLSMKILKEPYKATNSKQRIIPNHLMLQQKIQDITISDSIKNKQLDTDKTIIKGIVMLPAQNDQQYTIPVSRQGSRVVKYDHYGLVFGGHSHRENIEIHAISLLNGQWKRKQECYYSQIEQLKQKQIANPNLRLGCYFSLNIDENKTIYAFGGEKNTNNRKTTNVITKICLEGDRLEWQQFQTSIGCRRNHSGIYTHNHLLVVGGIDCSDFITKYYNDFQLINLSKMQSSQFHPKFYKKQVLQNDHPFKLGIAYHSATLVGNPFLRLNYDFSQIAKKEEQVDQLFTKEGIYIFGGKDSEDNLYSELYQMVIDTYPIVVQIVETLGQKPPSRRSHSMNYDEKISALLLFGGTNEVQCFGDLHILLLKNYTWQKVQLQGYLEYPFRYEHCSVFNEDKLIVFGGLNQDGFLMYNPITIQVKFKIIQKHN